jgi:hypothetical protein
MLAEQTPDRSAVGKQLLGLIGEYHSQFSECDFGTRGGPLAGTLFWEAGKVVSAKLGAENDPIVVTLASMHSMGMAQVLMVHAREQVRRLRW